MRTLLQKPSHSRRRTSRLEIPEGVRVYWSCAGRSDVLRVRNVSFGGTFIQTRRPKPLGTKAEVDFLVEEGQIRTTAVVRHVQEAIGMGLQFSAIAQEDRPHLAALLTRLRCDRSQLFEKNKESAYRKQP